MYYLTDLKDLTQEELDVVNEALDKFHTDLGKKDYHGYIISANVNFSDVFEYKESDKISITIEHGYLVKHSPTMYVFNGKHIKPGQWAAEVPNYRVYHLPSYNPQSIEGGWRTHYMYCGISIFVSDKDFNTTTIDSVLKDMIGFINKNYTHMICSYTKAIKKAKELCKTNNKIKLSKEDIDKALKKTVIQKVFEAKEVK